MTNKIDATDEIRDFIFQHAEEFIEYVFYEDQDHTIGYSVHEFVLAHKKLFDRWEEKQEEIRKEKAEDEQYQAWKDRRE